MTFRDVAYKNFKAHIRKYTVYFICSSFTIMTFFMYLSLIQSHSINEFLEKNSNIKQLFTTAIIGLTIFSIVFIIYAHAFFIKSRSREFGMYMLLGMTMKDIRKIILLENSIIFIASTFLGLLSGTVFSRLFFLIVAKILDINDITFSFNSWSFIYTLCMFGSIFLIMTLISSRYISYIEIQDLMKMKRKNEKNRIRSVSLGITGFLMITLSLVGLYKDLAGSRVLNSFPLYSFVIFVGLYITISQFGSTVLYLLKKNKKIYYRKLLPVSSVNSKFRSNKNIIFVISLLSTITIFFLGIAYTMYNQAVNRASYEQPFHIAYVEIYDKNRIGDGDLFKILNQNQTPLLNHKTIDFIRGGLVLPGTTYRPGDQIPGADIMSVKDFNELFGKSIQIEEGHLINFMQTPAKYARNDSFFNTCRLEAGGTVYSFTVDKTICEMVINKTHFISSTIRLINHKDFINMQSKAGSYGNGKIHLINFKNWRLTENISQKIDLALKEYNRNYSKTKIFNDINSEEYLFASTSRIQTYLKFKHEGGAALFLMGFTGLLFFFSSGCILYFKLFAEMEDTKLKYRKLLGIGILQLELKKLISDELKIVFFTPMFIGCLLGCSFMYVLSSDSEMQGEFFIGSIIVAFAYFVFQAVYYLITQRKYINAIIDSNI